MITPADITHIPLIKSLAIRIWHQTYANILSAEQLSYMLDEIYNEESLAMQFAGGARFLLAWQKAEPVGFASFSAYGTGGGVYKLHKLYLDECARGRGLGKQLLLHVEQCCRDEHARVLELNVNRYNPTLDFYLAMGYHIVREEDIPFGPYFMNDYIMQKEL